MSKEPRCIRSGSRETPPANDIPLSIGSILCSFRRKWSALGGPKLLRLLGPCAAAAACRRTNRRSDAGQCTTRVAGCAGALPHCLPQGIPAPAGGVIQGIRSASEGEAVRQRAPRRGPRRTLRGATGGALRFGPPRRYLVAEHAHRCVLGDGCLCGTPPEKWC